MMHKDKQPFCLTNFCHVCENSACKIKNNWLYKHEDSSFGGKATQ